MKRYAAFDPPEYVNWQPDPAVQAEWTAALDRDPRRRELIRQLQPADLLGMYEGMLRTRLHDVMLKRWVRQGVISKAWLGTGEEAVTVGAVHALRRDRDHVLPMIRNAGALCEMGVPVADMLRGYLGTEDSPSRGRDGHVGSFAHRVVQPISNIGNMPPVAAGIALAERMAGRDTVALTWIGDGSVKTGATHEALNFAAVRRLNVIFIVQNNQVALGTRLSVNHLPADFRDLHAAYGVPGWSFDGNNVVDAWAATRLAVAACLDGDGPVILDANTLRMGGHATHDEAEARHILPPELFAWWGQRDPVGTFEEYLVSRGFTRADLGAIEERVIQEVDRAAEEALSSRDGRMPRPESALEGVYAR